MRIAFREKWTSSLIQSGGTFRDEAFCGLLLLLTCSPCFGQSKLKPISVKDCLNYINTASGMASDLSSKPFSNDRLQTISDMEDKLISCANLPSADAKLLYSLFDAEVRIAGVKQVWLTQFAMAQGGH